MKLSRLIRGTALEDHIGRDVEITSLTCDTRDLCPGALFGALKGARFDGNDFIEAALQKGAAAVLCEVPPPYPGPWLVAENAREVFGELACNWFGRPGDRMTLVGVTGTNGKTTTTYLLKAVLEKARNVKVGLIGTNQNLIGERPIPARRTTPDAYTLQCLLAQMEREGCRYVVMEVSSHALALERTAGLSFAAGIFTNLTRDHLDFHGTMEDYRGAKAKLFRHCSSGHFNADDPTGRQFAEVSPCTCHTFSAGRFPAQVTARRVRLFPDSVEFFAEADGKTCPVRVGIPGAFTVSNALGVISCCLGLGLELKEIAAALATVQGVKGRAEVVPTPAPYTVLIDYAHTPDALEKILTAARDVTRGRLICLFGCGGDRDRTKRPIMGEIAAELSDLVLLTSDNPRTEDPEKIMDDVAAGFPPGFSDLVREVDRRSAIRTALELGRRGDVILLAGKGHETYQEVGTQRVHLDEREEIASFFKGTMV